MIRTGLSFINFNARSLNTTYDKIRDYVYEPKIPFDIAISKTWLESDECTNMLLAGYRVIHRTGKQ